MEQSQSSHSGMIFFASFSMPSMKDATWILYFGATSHIVHSISLFSSYTQVHNLHVLLPNNCRVAIHSVGVVKLSNALVLKIVFYIPSFQVNLLSIPALLRGCLFCDLFY